MTAPEPEEFYGNAEFSFSRHPVKGRRFLNVRYREIKLSMSWAETAEGATDLGRFAVSFPRLIKNVLREMLVRSEMDDLDDTIERLLEGEDK